MNIFKQFFKSIYSPKDIAMFRFQGIGKTILFVFFLTLISVLPSIFYLSSSISTGIEQARTVIGDNLPSFQIKNGQLTADTKVPIKINKDDFTFILDPTGAITESDVNDEGNAFALLKDRFVLHAGPRTDTTKYSVLQDITITKKELLDFINNVEDIKGVIIPVISIVLYLGACASSFIEVSVLAAIGLLLKNMAGRRLNYRQLWRMSAYSETLPTVFFTIMAALKTTVPNSFFINWAVIIIVLYLAINETPKPKKKDIPER
jgi:hypothetical protein